LQPGELAGFRATVARRLGLNFDVSKRDELAEVLLRRMTATNISDVDSYLCLLGTSLQELREVVVHLTIPETYFFRIPDHFRALEEVVLPERIKARGFAKRLNILSAGCASGEEPYTIAMLVQNRADLNGWQVSIKGIDVNPAVIAKGKKGRYTQWSLREIDATFQERCFSREGREYQLCDPIRNMVSLEEGNLANPEAAFWMPHTYDVIFFRNAFMYFSSEAGQAIVDRMAESLAPGGFLFMGPAETLRGLSHNFHLCHTHETFYYQLRTADSTADTPSLQWLPTTTRTPATGPFDQPAAGVEIREVDSGGDWANTINQATERVRMLSHTPERPRQTTPLIANSTQVDLSSVLSLLQNERFEQALEALAALPAEAQRNPEVQVLKAALIANRGDTEKAEETCASALKADGMNAGAYYVMALCREQLNDRKTAMENDRTAIYLDPSFAMPHLHLGLLAKRGDDLGLAAQELSLASLLLPREDAQRVLLFGGGFNRDTLVQLSLRELQECRRQA
jgi:chemotaxis protein methyltransferase CheR